MNISNYFQYNDKLASGEQPAREQFVELKEIGIEVVVNISTATAKNALIDEAKIVEQLKMNYIHFPVDCSNLQSLYYAAFKGIMHSLENKKVFVHCGANVKSSNLIHMYQVLEKNVDEKQSFQTLLKIQKPEEKWISYFKMFGMKGINNN